MKITYEINKDGTRYWLAEGVTQSGKKLIIEGNTLLNVSVGFFACAMEDTQKPCPSVWAAGSAAAAEFHKCAQAMKKIKMRDPIK
jgi:hypothetical protein